MKAALVKSLYLFALVAALAIQSRAQDHATMNDPRVGLKAGLYHAGEAARNMERLASLPKPPGFFDPKSPAGETIPPEQNAQSEPVSAASPSGSSGSPTNAAPAASAGAAGESEDETQRKSGQTPPSIVNFANSDLAFSGNHLFMGSFHGFTVYDITSARRPRLLASIVCPGGQGDVSVYGNLLFMSVEQTRGRIDCGTQGVEPPVSKERFRGVRIFDISDLRHPKQLAAIQTCRGSHTHTLVVDPGDQANVYVYGSGTSAVRPGEELEGCSDKAPEDDPNTSLFSIDVIKVPLNNPAQAAIVNRPRLFADERSGAIAGLWPGGNYGPGTQTSRVTNQCHDITVYPSIGLAAAACAGNGILLDVADPVRPVRLDAVGDKNFAYWHSATLNNDGTKVIFTDEWGGGTRPRCRAIDPINWGADAIFDVVDKKLQFRSYYKIPAVQTEQENCVAHNGSLIPVPGRDIMVQGWYQGGVSVFDFTDSARPVEIAFFDRGPVDAKNLILGGYWSAYWYNGLIYGSEIARGIDVFALKPSEYLSQNEIDAAGLVHSSEFNPQEQQKNVWPAAPVVARAYLDQLNRSHAIQPAQAGAVKSALDAAEKVRSGHSKSAETAARQLESLAALLERDAASAHGRDGLRLRSLVETMKGCAEKLRS